MFTAPGDKMMLPKLFKIEFNRHLQDIKQSSRQHLLIPSKEMIQNIWKNNTKNNHHQTKETCFKFEIKNVM
jgi:hypothetical protein